MKKLFLLINLFAIIAPITAQNIGIGTATPAAKLEVHHRSNTAVGLKLVDSATNLSGTLQFQNINFSRGIRASGFAASNFNNGQYLDIRTDSIVGATFKGNGFTGIRNLEPAYPLDVSGDINTTGRLLLNGAAGSVGQVLTSNGSADPAWQMPQSLYPGTYRAMFPFLATPITGAIEADVVMGTAHYNLNVAAISPSLTFITINTTGLYDIEGKATFNSGNVTVAAGGSPYAVFNIKIDNGSLLRTYNQVTGRIDQLSVTPGALSFLQTYPFKVTLHITAGSIISFSANLYQYATASGTPQLSGGYAGIKRIE